MHTSASLISCTITICWAEEGKSKIYIPLHFEEMIFPLVLSMIELILAEGGHSVVEDLDGNSCTTNVDAVRHHQSEHASFQDQVLAMLYVGGLYSHMQSMGERLSKLEQERLSPDLHANTTRYYNYDNCIHSQCIEN